MGFFRQLGAAVRLLTRADQAEQQGSLIIPTRDYTATVSVDTAVSLPAVFGAFRILCTAASQLGLGVDRAGRRIDTPAVIEQPDVYRSRTSFLKRTVASLAGCGNAYWRRYVGPDGRSVVNLESLNPLAIGQSTDRHGRRWWHYSDPVLYPGGVTWPEDQVVQLRFLELPGHRDGLGPIQACRLSLAGGLDLREYASNWFSSGTVPSGVLSTDQRLDPGAADGYKQRWHDMQVSGDVAVLGQGLDYEPIVLRPADAQFLESQQFSVTDIARMFGIPAAHLLAEVEGSSMTYQNLEQADTSFLRYTLMAYLTEIEDALTAQLPRGQRARFLVDGLLRPDSKTRSEVYTAYIDSGVMTVNEVRAIEGLDPIPGGDQPRPAAPASAPTPEVTAA